MIWSLFYKLFILNHKIFIQIDTVFCGYWIYYTIKKKLLKGVEFMNIMLFGAPELEKELKQNFNRQIWNSSNFYRRYIESSYSWRNSNGIKAKNFMDDEKLVPDSTIIGIIKERLARMIARVLFLMDSLELWHKPRL